MMRRTQLPAQKQEKAAERKSLLLCEGGTVSRSHRRHRYRKLPTHAHHRTYVSVFVPLILVPMYRRYD